MTDYLFIGQHPFTGDKIHDVFDGPDIFAAIELFEECHGLKGLYQAEDIPKPYGTIAIYQYVGFYKPDGV
jgi:hypothetical protein